ncbi:MAG TPA: NAD(P)/FAD-dependent oxidoreductase [candidate division Zixibacteria bacterium]|nr:NAD(P)/FAD-dependent oxidoreductase [candidate division Zixibacteria bacterium]MDD4916852.1 NAD(P)/FAD-dependent oxidoreductase [candidate division Zixibacteria bacterium]MDM7973923.1 NAD(P)/FAD-dependent oxidoreductase [candidate division Zixibacteria bacterium]HOD65146.1 NAD(P)/FAD-dependent oxidoreductase [candidate division Zixibacteria bacterium]HPC10602.1 NAD(P)/FAD-dependent oxidoreductase [candidate division Zixibacteria bacterium]
MANHKDRSDRRRLRLGVVGGGAAGLFAAIAAAETGRPGEVIVWEATGAPLDKVRLSGGGRCNVTHRCFEPADLVKNYPRGERELRGPFARFQPRDMIAWLEGRGVRLKAEADGRVFPASDDSGAVVACLLREAERAGVRIRLGSRVREAAPAGRDTDDAPLFDVIAGDGSREQCDRLLIAAGGGRPGHALAQALGHTIVPPVPSLFTFTVPDLRLQGLAGVSFESVQLRLAVGGERFEQSGPMLITHWGLSGPAVIRLSAWAARPLHESRYRAELVVNFVPGSTAEQVYRGMTAHKQAHGKRLAHGDSPVSLPSRYWSRIAAAVGIPPETAWAAVTREHMAVLAEQVTETHLAVAGRGIFKEEFVTCGGVALGEVDFRTMESRLRQGLYFAGEVLDIDGLTGGFNLQSAWTTGWIAGRSMAGVK